jgi:hypothetical protein
MAFLDGVIGQEAVKLVLDSSVGPLRLDIGSFLVTTHRLINNGGSIGPCSRFEYRVFKSIRVHYMLSILGNTSKVKVSIVVTIYIWTSVVSISYRKLCLEDHVLINHETLAIENISPHRMVIQIFVL